MVVLFALIIAGAVDIARGLSGGLPTTGFARAYFMFSGFMIPVSAQDVPVRGGFAGLSKGGMVFLFLLFVLPRTGLMFSLWNLNGAGTGATTGLRMIK